MEANSNPTRNYIAKLVIPGLPEPLYPASPLSSNKGAINVLCGPNNSGKSHLLKVMSSILSKRQAANIYDGYEIVPQYENVNISHYLSGPYWIRKEKIGIISDRYRRIDPNKPDDHRNFSLKFFYEQLIGDQALNLNEFTSNAMLERLDAITEDEFKINTCNSNHPIVSLIEEILQVKLLYRKTNGNIEFMIANYNGLIVPYSEWSDGQKSLFYFFLCLEYWNPDLLLADEIENHLHPLYMSTVLDYIKRKIPQTFIATHHPHVIFSEYIDQVFYIETVNSRTLAIPSKYHQIKLQKDPKRKVMTLSTSFSKLAAIYKLFSVQDRQLLKQSSQMAFEADFRIYEELISMFAPIVIEGSHRTLPDRQTIGISSLLKSTEKKGERRILDFGAGLGRVVKEFEKIRAESNENVTWLCWEPNLVSRETLKGILKDCNINNVVLDDLNDLIENSCDFAVIANVIHELNPQEFMELLTHIQKYLAPEGHLIIAEIFPLLLPEKYMVPYPSIILSELLFNLGFTCSSRSFPIRDAEGYCLIAKPIRLLPDQSKIINEIETSWEKIKRFMLSSYHTRTGLSDTIDYKGILCEFGTITSIEAWKASLWIKH